MQITRTGRITHVENKGNYLGYVRREIISNSSARGGAERISYVAFYSNGTRENLGRFDTRKDAIAAIEERDK